MISMYDVGYIGRQTLLKLQVTDFVNVGTLLVLKVIFEKTINKYQPEMAPLAKKNIALLSSSITSILVVFPAGSSMGRLVIVTLTVAAFIFGNDRYTLTQKTKVNKEEKKEPVSSNSAQSQQAPVEKTSSSKKEESLRLKNKQLKSKLEILQTENHILKKNAEFSIDEVVRQELEIINGEMKESNKELENIYEELKVELKQTDSSSEPIETRCK